MSSSERSGEFYGVWPVLDGKQLNLQWGEIRRNTAETKAVVRGSFQDIEDGADSLNALRALIGLAFGEQGFDNKYRLAYNKTTSEFCAQKNDGTEAVPVWQDVWCIRFSDGQFQVTSEGGIQSNAGFYGPLPHDLLAIGEILTSGALGGTQFVNPNELYFNTNTGFYLTSVTSGPRAGKPIVNFAFPFGKSKSFDKSGKVWQVAHNFNTKPVMVQTMNDGDVVVIPDKVDVSDPNNAWFYFNEVTSGRALIATGGTGAVEMLPTLDVTDGANTYNNISDLNFSGDGFYLSSDLNGAPVVNLEDITREGDEVVINPPSGSDIRLKPKDDGVVALDNTSGAELNFDTGGTRRWRITDESTAAAKSDLVIGRGGSNSEHVRVQDSPPRLGINRPNAIISATLHVGGPGIYDEQVTATAFYTTGAKAGEVRPLTVTDGTSPFTDVETAHFNNINFYITEKDGQPVINIQSVDATLVDHGSLSGLADDDHAAYPLVDMSRGFDNASNGAAVLNLSQGSSSTGTLSVVFQDQGVSKWSIKKNSANNLVIRDIANTNEPVVFNAGAASNTLVIAANSRIGIGTATPSATLEVVGHGRFSEQLEAGAFYLQPGSGGSIFKDGENLGISGASVDAQIVLKSRAILQPDDASIIGKVSPNGFALNFAPSFSTSATAGVLSGIQIVPSINVEDTTYRWRGITSSGQFTAKVDAGSTAVTHGYRTRLDIRADLGFIAGNYVGLADETEFKHVLSSDNTAKPMDALISVLASPTIEASAVGAQLRTDSFTALKFLPLLDTAVAAVVDLGAVRGLWCANPATSAGGGLAGTEQADSYTGVDVESPAALTISGNTIALNSAITAGATNYLIKNPGGAQSDFGGGDIIGAGSIGSGITPLYNLHVYEDTSAGGNSPIQMLEQDGAGDVSLGFLLSATAFWGVGIDNSDDDTFKIHSSQNSTWNDTRLAITTGGRVGIGTTTPSATLEVVGHGRFSEQLEAGAFYLQPGSGGGLWKESNNVVLGAKDGHVVLKVNGNSSAIKIDPVNPGVSQSYLFAAPNFSTATSGVVTEIFIRHNPVVSVLSVSYIPAGVKLDGTYTQGAVPNVTFGDSIGVHSNQTWVTEGTFGLHRTKGFTASQTLKCDGGGTPTETVRADGFVFQPELAVTTTSDRMAVTEMVAVLLDPRWNTVASATIDFGTIYGLKGLTPTQQLFGASAGTEEMEGYILVHLEDITTPASIGTTGVTCVKSDLSAGATNWFLDNPGGAQSDLGGGDLFNIGDVGFFGAAAQSKPTVTGSRTDGTALADLLTELATLGLITDSSSA